jgi:predicted GIY-YIG superfamily endonuclease
MHEGGYFTYIVASRSRMLYVGVTGNLQKRLLSTSGKNTTDSS